MTNSIDPNILKDYLRKSSFYYWEIRSVVKLIWSIYLFQIGDWQGVKIYIKSARTS